MTQTEDPGVKKMGRGKGWRKGLGKNQLAQNRLPMVGTKTGRSEVELQQRMVSTSDADSATDTDPGLPQSAREWRRRQEDADSGEHIASDLNVLSMSAESRERNRGQRTRNETEKRRRPAIKRPRLHQQLQLLHQTKKAGDDKRVMIVPSSSESTQPGRIPSPVQYSTLDGAADATRRCFSSESDRELQPGDLSKAVVRFHGVEPQRSNGTAALLSHPRRDAEHCFVASNALLRRMHTERPVQRTVQWREVDLGNIHPTALIGRACKVYWPLDDDWYPGVIHDYNPLTKKHGIYYEDNDMEMVLVSEERFQLKLSSQEWVELETSTGEQLPSKPEPRVEEERFGRGDLVWAKVKGYPMRPAIVMDEDRANARGMDPRKSLGTTPIQFFGSYDYWRLNTKELVLFAKIGKQLACVQELEEVVRYLKERKLPDSMAGLEDGAVEASGRLWPEEIESKWPKQESRDEGKRRIRKQDVTFPLQFGALTVVSLGAVVTDSEHFHDQQYIWPEGYTSIRPFPSAKDPDATVEYELQVFRNPSSRSHPLFRVVPADDTPVEGPSPYECWKKAFQRLRKAFERVGKSPELDKRMQFRSAPHVFGFSNPRVSKMIQSLPHARACTKFTNWSVTAEDEDVLPAGYHPVDNSWKHPDRCTVCYVDEECDGNLLLQCDKCRSMVHMNCYGESKSPDGDLWLCNLCRPEAPKTRPPCCLCPVTSGAMKKTTDGRWVHITCAMWIPETYLVDVKQMEPVDGVNAVAKERWRLTCSICQVPYGACIQCSENNCRTAFHPLCARSAGLHMEVLEKKQKANGETDLRLLAYCRKHKPPTNLTYSEVLQPTPLIRNCLPHELPVNASGCARCEPDMNAEARRGLQQPEALAAGLAKRLFVENLPHVVTGCRQISGCSNGPLALTPGEILSTSDKIRRMKSSMKQRLVFGKSAIHGMGVFARQRHCANDMMTEYVGEVVRPVIADLREKRCYDSLVGAGTYMFRMDHERVVDATRAGSIASLMNHSCEPNCYSRIVTACGKDRIIIYAKRYIAIGEELTYDYRFISKDEVLTCHCGCVGCRGTVNVLNSDHGDLDQLSVRLPLADLIRLPATTRGHTH